MFFCKKFCDKIIHFFIDYCKKKIYNKKENIYGGKIYEKI